MPGHDHFHRHHARDQSTIVSVVYVTAPKTFEGEVGGYTTLGPIIEAPTHAPAPAPAPPATTASADIKSAPLVVDTSSHVVKPVPSTTLPVTQPQHTTLETSAVLPASIVPSSSIVPTSILLAAASSAISSSSSALLSATPSLEAVANASSTPSASSVAKESSGSGGMSTGGKVGLAVGIVCLVATVIAVVGFCFMRKRRAADRQRLDDENEKQDAFAAIARQASTRTTATAPRLSLRPVTEFLPNLAEKRQSRGNALATPPPNTAGGADANNLNNPFGNHAETIDAANASGPAVVDDVTPKGEIIAAASTGAAAGAATGLVRGASIRGQGPKAMDFTTKGPLLPPPSPSGTEFSVSSDATATPTPTGTGAAIAAAGGPANSTVHRVQLDFNPSMDDELELRAGQLIRLLHEYDDGWVSSRSNLFASDLTRSRHSASVSTALAKVSSLVHVSRSAPSSLVLRRMALAALLPQACASPFKRVPCPLP